MSNDESARVKTEGENDKLIKKLFIIFQFQI